MGKEPLYMAEHFTEEFGRAGLVYIPPPNSVFTGFVPDNIFVFWRATGPSSRIGGEYAMF